MSYREKQRMERCIEFLHKFAFVLYIVAIVEIACYVLNVKIAFIEFRSISVERYAFYVALTLLVGFLFQQIAKKVKEAFVKKLKYTR